MLKSTNILLFLLLGTRRDLVLNIPFSKPVSNTMA